jgi:hypothetical protein
MKRLPTIQHQNAVAAGTCEAYAMKPGAPATGKVHDRHHPSKAPHTIGNARTSMAMNTPTYKHSSVP